MIFLSTKIFASVLEHKFFQERTGNHFPMPYKNLIMPLIVKDFLYTWFPYSEAIENIFIIPIVQTFKLIDIVDVDKIDSKIDRNIFFYSIFSPKDIIQ